MRTGEQGSTVREGEGTSTQGERKEEKKVGAGGICISIMSTEDTSLVIEKPNEYFTTLDGTLVRGVCPVLTTPPRSALVPIANLVHM